MEIYGKIQTEVSLSDVVLCGFQCLIFSIIVMAAFMLFGGLKMLGIAVMTNILALSVFVAKLTFISEGNANNAMYCTCYIASWPIYAAHMIFTILSCSAFSSALSTIIFGGMIIILGIIFVTAINNEKNPDMKKQVNTFLVANYSASLSWLFAIYSLA